jgi:hypothetical protein
MRERTMRAHHTTPRQHLYISLSLAMLNKAATATSSLFHPVNYL